MNSSDPYAAPAAPLADVGPSGPSRHFLLRCWRGEARLWQAFWLLLVGAYLLINLLALGLVWGAWILGEVRVVAAAFFMVLNAMQLLFGVISVWRCARNTRYFAAFVIARAFVILLLGIMLLQLFRLWTL